MLLEEIKNIKSEKKDLRNFGMTFGVVLGLLGGLLWWKGKDTYALFLGFSLAFVFFGFLLPALLKPLQKVWMAFAVVMGWFMTRVILSVLYYVVFTFIGLGARMFGKQFLDLKIDNTRRSYWLDRKSEPFDRSRYEKQF